MDAERTHGVSSEDGNTSNTQGDADNTQGMSTNESQHEKLNINQEDNGTRKRKLTSPAWEHFDRKIVNGELKAQCKHCRKFLTGKSTSGITHLLVHMEKCKAQNNRDIRQTVLSINQSSTSGHSNLSYNNFDKEKSTRDLAEMVILHEYPLVMVEHQGFRKFVNGLQPFFKVPCRNTLKKEILKIFEYEKTKTMRFIYVPSPHTAEVLADVLYETLCDWNIDRKISTKESEIVSFWTASAKRIEKFEEASCHLDIQSSKKLCLDCRTRWNSTYLMLNVAIIYKSVFRRLKTQDALYNTLPSEKDWELANIICKKLKVFYDVTLLFSGDKYPTANLFVKSIYEIKYALNQWSEDEEKIIRDMAMKMISKYDKYWNVIHGFMGVAAILDPRYKLNIMEYSFPRLYSNMEDVKAKIDVHKVFMYELFEHYQEDAYNNAGNHVNPMSNNKNTGSGGLFDDYSSYMAEDTTSGSIKLELDHYLEEKVCPPGMDLDILAWWKTNGVNTSGRLVSLHRSRLHPDTLEALMCAQSWLLAEIRATCCKESEAYCQTVNYDYDELMADAVVDG
ncbi:zinc finger BED domain-containing protein RICESLEEPER 2-like [Rutidosis leptorrhynchoides]|uniref:zinc finger BED domain-containing protein RICESLEEPER 2-like n=1 Tax=Rutidosis leptorrhynchoides TaxID=125765 RepID=UPI003A990F0E